MVCFIEICLITRLIYKLINTKWVYYKEKCFTASHKYQEASYPSSRSVMKQNEIAVDWNLNSDNSAVDFSYVGNKDKAAKGERLAPPIICCAQENDGMFRNLREMRPFIASLTTKHM